MVAESVLESLTQKLKGAGCFVVLLKRKRDVSLMNAVVRIASDVFD